MTPIEARDYIIRHCNPDYPHGKTEWETAINMAIEALEKDIPKKPKLIENIYPTQHECPSCGCSVTRVWERPVGAFGTMTETSIQMRCLNCGQRIER